MTPDPPWNIRREGRAWGPEAISIPTAQPWPRAWGSDRPRRRAPPHRPATSTRCSYARPRSGGGAWDVDAHDWRLFRLDRMIDLLVREEHFPDREGFRPVAGRSDLLRAPPAAVERVRVRFSARVAPRVRERYPDCQAADGGAVVVTFQSSGVEWLVRRVLEYGADAEVLEPAMYREAMRRAVAA